MPDREAFLRTICDHPDDDGPRLVFADWLEEQGDPLAERIRLQVERHRVHVETPQENKLKRQLTDRADELQSAYAALRESLPQLEGIEWGPTHRGFIRTIRVDSAARFLESAAAIFAAAPITDVWFTGLDTEGAAALADSRFLLKVQLLKNFGAPIGDAGMIAIANSKHAANLRRLFLNSNQIGDDGARAIARSKWFGELTTLFLHNNRIADEGALALADSKRLPKVTEIFLVANELQDAGLTAIRNRWGKGAHVG